MIYIKDNETENEALWRIGQDKTNNIIDDSWIDIADIFNKHFREDETEYYDSSAYRKKYKNFLDAYEQIFSKTGYNDEMALLDQKRNDIIKERRKLYATKLEYNRNLNHESRFELFYENIKDAIIHLDPPNIEATGINYVNCENEYMLLISDLHYGAKFKSANNEYSTQICKDRFSYMLGETIKYVRVNNITNIKILNLSDSIQGLLRVSDIRLNETEVVTCVVEISQLISDFLNKLSAYCNIEYIHVSSANHSQTRPLGSKASELASEDVEKIICNYIKDSLKFNDRINVIFDINKEYIEFEVAGFQCIAEHGHRVKNINKYLNDKSLLHRKMYSYGFLGHTHSNQCITVGEENKNNVEVIVAPSFVGSCPYADTLNVGAKASVNILKFNKTYGHIGTETIILN